MFLDTNIIVFFENISKYIIFVENISNNMRFITLLLALALGTMSLSAQENIITPAPVRVQGGICVDDFYRIIRMISM